MLKNEVGGEAVRNIFPVKFFVVLIFLGLILYIFAHLAGGQEAKELYEDARKDYLEGRLTQAIEKYERFLQQNPMSISAMNDLGCCYMTLGDHQKAIEILEKAAASEPENTIILYNLGSACFAAGNLDGAKAQFEKVLSLDPKESRARQQLVVVHMKQNNSDEAHREAQKLIDENPEDLVNLKLLMHIYLQKNQREKARKLCDKILSIDNNDIDANNARAMLNGKPIFTFTPKTTSPTLKQTPEEIVRRPLSKGVVRAVIGIIFFVFAIMLVVLFRKPQTSWYQERAAVADGLGENDEELEEEGEETLSSAPDEDKEQDDESEEPPASSQDDAKEIKQDL